MTAEARKLQARDPRKIAVMERGDTGRARWHEIWQHNPRLAHPDEARRLKDIQWLRNFGGARPYIDYSRSTPDRYRWTDYRVEPGEIYLDEHEKAFAKRHSGVVIIEPNVKSSRQVNKDWGWGNWVTLTDMLPHVNWVQIGGRATRLLPRVRHIQTFTLRIAAAIVSKAAAIVTSEGGLHHCAAVFGVPGVVIFGGFISPATTGYDCHANLFTGGEACGWRIPCVHCRDAMNAITPEMVAERLLRLLKKPA